MRSLQIEHFRCISSALIDLSPQLNLFFGANGAGKTSILEAASTLNSGRSFRSYRSSAVIETGQLAGLVVGEVETDQGHGHSPVHRLGVQIQPRETLIKIDGEIAKNRAELAQYWVAQVIDPDIHFLVDGGPDQRRAFLNWGVFHVEPSFLDQWQRYRKILQQRNRALKEGQTEHQVRAWDPELIELGEQLRDAREDYLSELQTDLSEVSQRLLSAEVQLEHRWGWAKNSSLGEALGRSLDRDRQFKSTQAGPHRADIIIHWADHRARSRVSRGQQKLVALSLKLAQTQHLIRCIDKPVVLLLDDPAAELDRDRCEQLFDLIGTYPIQMLITAIDIDRLPVTTSHSTFHVEQGRVSET